jgi:hypothetical protein
MPGSSRGPISTTVTREELYRMRGEPVPNGNGTTSSSNRCEQCDSPLEGARRYCSEKCRAKARRARAAADVSTTTTSDEEAVEVPLEDRIAELVDRDQPLEVRGTPIGVDRFGELMRTLAGVSPDALIAVTLEYDGVSVTIGRTAE